ncbi:Uncharacterised protein g5732 [Pycnogonum litorale]
MPSKESEPGKVQELRETGNTCIKNGNFAEAILHYSHAIKLDPKQYQLYSNRSHAFLKMNQFYFAHQDALQTIRLKPDWAKGYFRAGESEFYAQQYEKAIESYRKSMQLEANQVVMEKILAARNEAEKIKNSELQMPWYGMAIGVLCGIFLVVLDQAIAKVPVVSNPVFQALIIIMFSVVGLLLGIGYRSLLVSQRNSLFEPPPDLFNEGSDNGNDNDCDNPSEQKKEQHRGPHYKKATARQRYQKGKG